MECTAPHTALRPNGYFGLRWVALRALWGRSVIDLNPDDVSRARAILRKYDLRVSEIAGPLFKVDWPGAPRSRFSAKQNFAKADFAHQHNVLSKCLALAQQFNTDQIRCFDFWRLDDIPPHRAAIDDLLHTASEATAKQGIILMVENDFECNTATAPEAARLLGAVPGLMLNWDPATLTLCLRKRKRARAVRSGWTISRLSGSNRGWLVKN